MQEDLKKAGPTLESDGGEGAWLAVDEEASLLLVSRSARVAGRIVELSMTGCRINTWEKSPPAVNLRVEAAFRVNGIAFRFSGVTVSNDGHRLVEIRFLDLTSRRLDELIEVLAELAADALKKAEKDAAEKKAAEEAAEAARAAAPDPKIAEIPATARATAQAPLLPPLAVRLPQPVSPPAALHLLARRSALGRLSPLAPLAPAATVPQVKPPQPTAASPAPAKPSGRDRRTQSRLEVDTSAIIFLVNVASRINGRIMNLSIGGCRIRTDERFPVGIYTRVETEFQLEGLSFRLGGVVQAIQDKQHVGIRFLDMSERKRGLLIQLIEEVEELHKREKQ